MPSLIPRNAGPIARGALEHFSVVVLEGARRVGKSTLAKSLAEGVPHVHASLDDPAALEAARDDPRGFLAQRSGRLMVIDEVQRLPQLALAIKADVDREPAPGSYLLTGSSDFTTSPRTPDSLAGRAATIRLWPFSQGELHRRREDFATWARDLLTCGAESSVPKTGPGLDSYLEAIVRGGYPEAMELEERWRDIWMESYINRLTARDVLDIGGAVPAPRLQAVLRLLASNQAGELVKAHLARWAGIPERSAAACVDALGSLYLTAAVPPFTDNLTARLTGRSKALVADSGLAAHLTGATPDALSGDFTRTALGPLAEGFALAELLRQRTWSSSRWRLTHLRDRNGLEADAVIEFADSKVILLEVKASRTNRSGHFAPVKRLAGLLGERCLGGIVLTMDDHAQRFGETLWALPIATLWSTGLEGPAQA